MKDAGSAYVKVWEFRVKRGEEKRFEKVYGPDGDWNQLLKKANGYMYTQLFRDVDYPGRYMTIDYWNSRAAFDEFKLDFAGEYKALYERCESLTHQEKPIGSFSLGSAERGD